MVRAETSSDHPTLLRFACTEYKELDLYRKTATGFTLDANPTIAALLIRCGADVNAPGDSDAKTPVHFAAALCAGAMAEVSAGRSGAQGKLESAKAILATLIRHGAHMDVGDDEGITPVGILGALWPAVLEGQGEEVRSARVPPLRCLAAHAVLANDIDYYDRVPENVRDFVFMHKV